MYDNPQITKARSENFKLGIKEFSKLCMLVGISEAIRLLPTFLINIKYLFYLFKYSLQKFRFLYTKSLNDINDNDKLSNVNENKGSINSENNNEENFYE
jgi:hypothetical protein